MLKGLDVSSFQGEMDFSSYDFVIIKSSEGVNFVDPGLERHVNSALKTGTPFGFYHYARPDLGNTGAEEARSMLQYINEWVGSCLIALDWEQKSLSYPVSWIQEFLDTIKEETGVVPGLYIQANQATNSKYAPIAQAGYWLWVAHWETSSPSYSNWDTWTVWQYQGSPLDLDYFNGTAEDWTELAGGGTPGPGPGPGPEPEPTPVPTEWIKGNRYLSQSEMENNVLIINNYFSKLGWTLNAISGMLGNMQRESTINPGIWQNLDPSNPSVLGYGLVGWTPGTRITNWLREQGYAIDDGYGQCAKIWEEWAHPEREVVWIPTERYPMTFDEFVQSSESPEILASVFLYNYERAGVAAEDERRTNARKWFNWIQEHPTGGKYVPRLDSEGIEGNSYWYDDNPFYTAGYGLPNCTCYCWGRWWEIQNVRPELPLGNANTWWNDALEMGKKTGQEPQLGAIIVTWYSEGGHVAIVEQINDDGSIVTSNSGWPDDFFWIETLYPSNGYVASSWMPSEAYVQGFIYLDYPPQGGGGVDPEPPKPPIARVQKGGIGLYFNPWLRLKGRLF